MILTIIDDDDKIQCNRLFNGRRKGKSLRFTAMTKYRFTDFAFSFLLESVWSVLRGVAPLIFMPPRAMALLAHDIIN